MWGGQSSQRKFQSTRFLTPWSITVNRWLSARFNLLSSAVIGFTGFVAILSPNITAAQAGFALAFAWTVTGDVRWDRILICFSADIFTWHDLVVVLSKLRHFDILSCFQRSCFVGAALRRPGAIYGKFSTDKAVFIGQNLWWSQVAVERVKEFSEVPREPPEFIEPRPPASWPENGMIQCENLVIRYAVSVTKC